MRFALYNPFSVTRAGRLLHIATTIRADAILLPGACLRATKGESHRFERIGQDHWAIHVGYGSGPFTNKHAGCCIIFRNRTFPRIEIQSIAFSPKELQGRAFIVRFKQTAKDISLIVGYPPPHGQSANPAARKAAQLVNDWIRKQFQEIRLRSLPILGMNSNTQLGFDTDGTPWDCGLGNFNLGKATKIGQSWAFWFSRAATTSAGTLHNSTSHSYFHFEADRDPTYIDHIVIHQKLAEHPSTQQHTDWAATRKLQLLPGNRPRDQNIKILQIFYWFPFQEENRNSI